MKFKKDDYIVRYDNDFYCKRQRIIDVSNQTRAHQIYRLFDLHSGYVGDYDTKNIDSNYELDIKRMRKLKLRKINVFKNA